MPDMKSDPRECAICFQRFNYDDRQPRVFISCGHSACSCCIIQMIIKDKVHCPYCRAKCDITNVRQLPVNFGMLQLVDCPQSSEDSPAAINIPWVLSPKINAGLCEEHGQYKLFECTTCNQYICHVCTVLGHKQSCKIICIKKAIEIMKDSKMKEFNSELTSYEEMTQHLEDYKELLDKQISGHMDHIIKLEKTVEDRNDLVKKLQNECTKVREALEESGKMQSQLKTSRDGVTDLCGFHEVKDYIIEEDIHLKSAQTSRLQCIEEFPNRDIISSSLKMEQATKDAIELMEKGAVENKSSSISDNQTETLQSIDEKVKSIKEDVMEMNRKTAVVIDLDLPKTISSSRTSKPSVISGRRYPATHINW